MISQKPHPLILLGLFCLSIFLKVEVYVNSTNSNLDLKTGTLSQKLLKACGDELQKQCSEYSPLKPEAVAVTEAKNLHAQSIYHVALPDYQQDLYSAQRVKKQQQWYKIDLILAQFFMNRNLGELSSTF